MHHPRSQKYISSTNQEASRSRRSFLRRCAAGAGVAAVAAVPAVATTADESMFGTGAFVGEVSMFAGNFAPRGWAFCEGQSVSVQQNAALFAILGTTYGGDGKTNFKLPDLRKQANRLGVKYIIAIQGVFPPRS